MAAQQFNAGKFSESSGGLGILVTGNSSGTANTIHNAVSGTDPDTFDEIWLYAQNNGDTPVNLTIEEGSNAAKDNVKVPIKAKDGKYLIIPGDRLQNAAVVKAFADIQNVITITGWINKIRPVT